MNSTKNNNYNTIIESLFEAENTISMNKLQMIEIDVLCSICKHLEILEEGFTYSKRSDLINLLTKYFLQKNINIICSGIIDIIKDENYGFLRTPKNNYFVAGDDFFVSSKKIKYYNIKHADTITVVVSTFKDNDKRIAIDDVLFINGFKALQMRNKYRKVFDQLTPEFPREKFNLIQKNNPKGTSLDLRLIDLFAPIGKGQRGLIVAPPKCGKTTIFMNLADAISNNHKDVKVIILLVDERPEEVTDIKDKLGDKCMIFHSDFTETCSRHAYITELCIEHSKRLAELGLDVCIFMDSLTRLSRAFNTMSCSNGKVLSGGIDAAAIQRAKKVIGVARNVRNGGSVTFMGTCLYDTGSKMDHVLYEEFNGCASTLITLSRAIAGIGYYPALDLMNTGTRRCEILRSDSLRRGSEYIKRLLNKSKHPDAYDINVLSLRSYDSTERFLESLGFID